MLVLSRTVRKHSMNPRASIKTDENSVQCIGHQRHWLIMNIVAGADSAVDRGAAQLVSRRQLPGAAIGKSSLTS
jgi:hypothetical protein